MNTLFKALSHPVRRRIVAMLRAGPLASGDIAAAFDMSWPTITGHLNALKGGRPCQPRTRRPDHPLSPGDFRRRGGHGLPDGHRRNRPGRPSPAPRRKGAAPMTRRLSLLDLLTVAVFVVQTGFALHIGLNGPTQAVLPIHWNAAFEVDGWASGPEFAVLLGGLATIGLLAGGGLGLGALYAAAEAPSRARTPAHRARHHRLHHRRPGPDPVGPDPGRPAARRDGQTVHGRPVPDPARSRRLPGSCRAQPAGRRANALELQEPAGLGPIQSSGRTPAVHPGPGRSVRRALGRRSPPRHSP